MEYKKCQRCGRSGEFYVGAKVCVSCMKELGLTASVGNFSVAERNRAYGSTARKIYEGFCSSLGWDPDKAECFGTLRPLIARCADTDRTRDVWFVRHAERVAFAEDVDVQGETPIVVIGDGDLIYERRRTQPEAVTGDRIVFVSVEGMYVFYGVYRFKEYDEERGVWVFERYSDVYPLKD